MGFQNIEKKNLWYILTKKLLVDIWHNLVFYRKVIVYNRERIPKKGHLIFTPNHQNALLDALALLCTVDRQLIFLARSDIFRKKKIANILYYLKILPIFRIRDGYSEVRKNTDTFNKTIEVIKAGNGLVILPEGDYVRKHQLRPLKKGFARIAFQTEEANEFKLDLKIVPVGLHYSDYDEIRGELIINFGHPISVSDYYEIYQSSPAIAINQITKKLSESLKPLMLDLPDEDYKFFNDVLQIHVSRLKQLKKYSSKDLGIENEFIESLTKVKEEKPEEFKELKSVHNSIIEQLSKVGIKNRNKFLLPQKSWPVLFKTLQLILGLPFFLYGSINNFFPFLITDYIVKKVKDVGFRSSFRFVISLLAFPVFYMIQTILVFIFSNLWWLALIYFATLPVSWNFSVCYSKQAGKNFYAWKLILISLFKPKIFKELVQAQKDFLKLISVI